MSSPLPSKSRTPSVSEISEINNNQKGADMAVIDMPRSSAVETEISEISPDLARDLLAKNPHNRNLRVRRVEQLAGAMTRGEWVFNGDAIRIADSGMLLDGQHRLAAIVRSGIPQTMLVVSGLPAITQETMDSGAKRSAGDILKLRGEKDVNRLAAITRIVLSYEQRQTFRNPQVMPTTQEVVATLDRHPGIRGAVVQIRPLLSNVRCASGPMGAAYYFFSLVDPTDAELFITRLAMGTDLGELSPIHALRRQLTMPRGTRTMPMAIQGALTIKAWNYWRAGDTVKHLVWRPGGGTAEKFPMIDGLDLGDLAVAA